MGSNQHPLFPEPDAPVKNATENSPVTRVEIRVCRVMDWSVGRIGIFDSPHYFYARDLVKGESFHASRRAYQLYRSYQFGYSEDQTIIDANYFQEKVLSPNFALPIEGYFVLGKFHVSDGFHRLAIAAAHDLEFIPSLVSRRMRTLIERP